MNSSFVYLFFNLEGFSHKAIFDDVSFVWEVIPRLSAYLSQLPLGKIETTISPSVTLVHPELISIGEGSRVDPNVYIEGPCVIGRHCHIRHGAYLRGHVLTGDHCVIGHATEIKRSLLLNHVRAAHFNYVGDSILGNGANLGAGVKCANFRIVQGEIKVTVDGNTYKTGLKKLGAIIGDGVQIGCNSVTNPGTLIAKNVLCYPCINIKGFIPSSAVVKK